mmetsp:Transcript_8732/g.31156  ORF Transcript_8732/g.31156 Transcript_8732/m.31156 type:complete len:366 (-) Transcript_8732:472-1569(-)
MMMRAEAASFTPSLAAWSFEKPGASRPRVCSVDEGSISTAAPSPALTCASWSLESPLLSPLRGPAVFGEVSGLANSWLLNPEPLALPEAEEPSTFNSGFVLTGLEDLSSSIMGLLGGVPLTPPTSGAKAAADLEESWIGAAPSMLLPPPGLELPVGQGEATFEASPAPMMLPPGLEVESESEHVEAILPAGTTTAMLRNIPNKYTQDALLKRLQDGGYGNSVDFIYVPIDFKNRCNFGYAFLNFRTAQACGRFAAEFHGSESRLKLPGFQSRKICEVSPARHQGLDENVRRLRDSAVMAELVSLNKPDWMPKIFGKSGEAVEFPMPASAAFSAKQCASEASVAEGADNSRNGGGRRGSRGTRAKP